MKLLIINESHVVFKEFTRLLEALEFCAPSTYSIVAVILKEKEEYCFIKVLLVRLFIYLNQHSLICPTPPLSFKTLKSGWEVRAGGHGTQGLCHVHCDPAIADFLSSLKQAVPLTCAASSTGEFLLIFCDTDHKPHYLL